MDRQTPMPLEVGDRTYRIQIRRPGKAGNTVYFINEARGAIIDPGATEGVPEVLDAITAIGMTVDYIMPTHVHVDHGGASGTLAKMFPAAKVIVHPAARAHVIDPSRLIAGTKKSWGDRFEAEIGPILPVPEHQVVTPHDGDLVDLGGRKLKVIYTPGHSEHHIAFLDLKTRGLFCGEAAGMRAKSTPRATLPNAAPPNFDPVTYLDTLRMLRDLEPRSLLFAHDGVARDPGEIKVIFQSVIENTEVIGRIILEAMRAGGDNRANCQAFAAYLETLGVRPEELALPITVAGYEVFFRRKGLV